jgi:hypothetical protein
MKRLFVVMSVACAGEGKDPGASPLDCEVPQFALEDLDCVQLRDAWNDTVRATQSCEEDADCRALHPPCEHWSEVDCYYPVSSCFTEELLAQFDSASQDCTVVGTMTFSGCTCGDPPEVRCEGGLCTQ